MKKNQAMNIEKVLDKVRKEQRLIGRENEIKQLYLAFSAVRNVLIEGPVGVGKTVLAQALANVMGHKVIRIDGDSRFTEQKLTGWFDPSLVLKRGYTNKTFIPGPLVEAMQTGSILFINELNRMPESVQNVLLPAIDEGLIHIPQLGEWKAKTGFMVVATQNPREFVATAHLSEALVDRMEWVYLDYQSATEEKEIAINIAEFDVEPYASWSVDLVRHTRSHPKIKRGASVRASIAILKLLKVQSILSEESFINAALLALPTRIELQSTDLEGNYTNQLKSIIKEIFEEIKKKS